MKTRGCLRGNPLSHGDLAKRPHGSQMAEKQIMAELTGTIGHKCGDFVYINLKQGLNGDFRSGIL